MFALSWMYSGDGRAIHQVIFGDALGMEYGKTCTLAKDMHQQHLALRLLI